MMMKVVSQQGLENLRGYSYHGEDRSISARLFLNAFWEWAVRQVPLWVAPNILTLCGCVFMVTATALCFLHTPTYTETLPAWVLVAAALLIFAYQTADNIDGKQARRTRAGSALGEIFDHGVDSLVMGMVMMILGSGAQAGPLVTVCCAVLTIGPFYAAHWEEYHIGMLIMGEYTSPTELQNVVMMALMGTAYFGADTWSFVLPFFSSYYSVTVGECLWGVMAAGSVVVWCVYGVSVGRLCWSGRSVMKSSTLAGLTQPLPFLVYTGLFLAWVVVSSAHVSLVPQLYLVAFTLAHGFHTQSLLVQRVCKEPFHFPISSFIPLLLVLINRCPLLPSGPVVSDSVALWFVLGWSLLQESIFVVSLITQLSSWLKIRPFVIPYPPPPPK